MICKKAIKNAVIFTAMLLIVGINSTPLISKAGNSFGVAFSVDGETTFTDTQSKSTSSSVQMLCTDKDIDGSYYYGKVYAYKSGQYYDVSHGYEYYFDVNETHNMLNWVNEGPTAPTVYIREYHIPYNPNTFGGNYLLAPPVCLLGGRSCILRHT